MEKLNNLPIDAWLGVNNCVTCPPGGGGVSARLLGAPINSREIVSGTRYTAAASVQRPSQTRLQNPGVSREDFAAAAGDSHAYTAAPHE